MALVPVIETARLRLRGHQTHRPRRFLRDVVGAGGGALHQRHAVDRDAKLGRILNYTGHWQLMGYGYWLVEERVTGRFAGEVGFADFKREIAEHMRDVPEAGWVLAPHAHGKGYATEAVEAMLRWGDEHLSSARSVCIVTEQNAPSIRIAERAATVRAAAPSIWTRPSASSNAFASKRRPAALLPGDG